jgi:glycosyltransferase involved in cell wall biosynthesis
LLFFGLLKAYKGLDVLLQSLARIREAWPEVLLLIAGESMMRRGTWQSTVRRLQLGAHLHWSGGFVPSEQVAPYFAAADVVVLPYLNASSSAVLLSAYAHGRPVVATEVGGLPEMIEREASGLLVPPGDPDALADALLELLGDPERRAAMGRRAQRLLQERHGWDRVGEQTEKLYVRLLEPASAA